MQMWIENVTFFYARYLSVKCPRKVGESRVACPEHNLHADIELYICKYTGSESVPRGRIIKIKNVV